MQRAAELELDCNLQSNSASIEAVCRKTRQDVNRDSGRNSRPKISVKNYMSSRIALSVVVTDSTVLGGDLIREGGQSGRGFGDDNDARRNKDIFEL